jgi:hypothetical protein
MTANRHISTAKGYIAKGDDYYERAASSQAVHDPFSTVLIQPERAHAPSYALVGAARLSRAAQRARPPSALPRQSR